MNNASIVTFAKTAPEKFTRDEDGGYSFVYKQPTSQEETDLCMEALEGARLSYWRDGEQQA